jgi:pilus assembly protein CpaE
MRTTPAREDGQAATELVALLPAVLLVLAVVAQFAVAGHAVWSVNAAAAHAARAAAVHADPRAAARAELPDWLRPDLRVSERSDGGVRVAVRIPFILGTGPLGTASAEARFEGQS